MSTATVLTMPGAREITVPVLGLDERMELLRRLAADAEDAMPELIGLALRAWASPALTPDARDLAWRNYLGAADLLRGLEDGTAGWRDAAPGLTGPERSRDALEIAAADERELLCRLAGAMRGAA